MVDLVFGFHLFGFVVTADLFTIDVNRHKLWKEVHQVNDIIN